MMREKFGLLLHYFSMGWCVGNLLFAAAIIVCLPLVVFAAAMAKPASLGFHQRILFRVRTNNREFWGAGGAG